MTPHRVFRERRSIPLSEPHVPELPRYVLSLVVVAAGGQNRSARERLLLANNAALRHSLDYAGILPSIGDDPASNATVRQWMDSVPPPRDLFEFTARLLDAIDMRVRGRHSLLPRAAEDIATVFDRAALLALGQVILGVGRVRAAGDEPVSDAFKHLAARSPRELQQLVIENYLGNILHDYFDAAEVRAAFSRLPIDTENNLRVKHGRAIAKAIFESLPDGDGPLSAQAIQDALREIVGLIWLEERRAHDQDQMQKEH
jgi:hypothetical protein